MIEGEGQTNDRIDQPIMFAQFSLHPGRQLLLEGRKEIPLGTRAIEILLCLTSRPGQLVTKDELIARAWPSSVVEGSSLRAQIASLRKALRDGQDGARFIDVVPGRGYRFVAPISHHGGQSNARRCYNNLTARPTRLIGRSNDVAIVIQYCLSGRLTTIVGPGGIGKTALCLSVAEKLAGFFEDGLCFVDIGPLAGSQPIESVLASALNILPASDKPLSDLVAFIRARKMLIVLDSCERVVESAAALAELLLRHAPGVHVLVTSREALRSEGENVYKLAPLGTPPVSAGLTAIEALSFPAVELFVERAASVGRAFELSDDEAPVVADICRQVDGIALAVELAAGRIDTYGARGIAERLDDRFRLLRGGRRTALPRHQTLSATLDWSYDFLSSDEQFLLRCLSVFTGEFTCDLVDAIVAGEPAPNDDVSASLPGLIAKSLVVVDGQNSVAKYRLLDTTRAYALNKIAGSNEHDRIVRRLSECLCKVLSRSIDELQSLSKNEWIDRYGRHINDVRMALDWAFSSNRDPAAGTALAIVAIPLWTRLALLDECRDRVQLALASVVPEENRNAHALRLMQLYRALGLTRIFTNGLASQASEAWIAALEIAEKLDVAEDRIEAYWGLWICQIGTGQYRAALDTARSFSALAESIPDMLTADLLIGMPLFCMGDQAACRVHLDRMNDWRSGRIDVLADSTGFRFDFATAMYVLQSDVLWLQGFPEQASRAAEKAIEAARSYGNAISLCDALSRAACPLALHKCDIQAADRSIGLLMDHVAQHSLGPWEVFGRCWKGALLIKRGDVLDGVEFLDAALNELQRGQFFAQYVSELMGILAQGYAERGDIPEAIRTIDLALRRCEQNEEFWCIAEIFRIRGEISLRIDPHNCAIAEQDFLRAIEWARRQEALSWELRAVTSLSRLWRLQDRFGEACDALVAVYSRFSEGFETTDLLIARELIDELS